MHSFMQMIEETKQGSIDLIVIREACCFAHNTVDTLFMTREFKNYGVEVCFVEDNIRTVDGEPRLTIMATFAQEGSRKSFECVRAEPQKTAATAAYCMVLAISSATTA